jgi:phosphoribosylaminoimidazole-succinocarboxamide synthase
MLPVECVVRGYITGSGWKDYQAIVEDRERGVASTGQLESHLQHAIEDRFAITDVDKPVTGVQKSP